jgi:hypothetical protein
VAFPTTSILDDFNRTNEGPPPSASWSTLTGAGHKVVSNQCVPDSGYAESVFSTSFLVNQEAFVTMPTLPSSNNDVVQLSLRFDGVNNRYVATYKRQTVGTDIVFIEKQISGVFTQIGANIDEEFSDGDGFGFRANGDQLTVYRNGSLIGTRTNDEITTSGQLVLGSDGSSIMDSFGGGSYVAQVATTEHLHSAENVSKIVNVDNVVHLHSASEPAILIPITVYNPVHLTASEKVLWQTIWGSVSDPSSTTWTPVSDPSSTDWEDV